MHVTQQVPVTWRHRTVVGLMAHLEVRARCVRVMTRLSDGAGIFARLATVARQVLTRIHKARSATQTPSALERHVEELTALQLAGQPAHVLRLSAVVLHEVITDLEARPGSTAAVLDAIATADQTEAAEQLAESRATTRADRQLTEGDLAEIEDRTRADIAADSEKLARCAALRRQLRASRGLAPITVHSLRRGRVA